MATELNLITAQVLNIKAYEGDSTTVKMFFKDSNSDPVALTGILVKCQIKSQGGVVMKTVSNISGILITGTGNNGLLFAPDFLSGLKKGVYRYDIQFTYNDGSIVTYVRGNITITDQTTV